MLRRQGNKALGNDQDASTAGGSDSHTNGLNI
jgi:hypothetical protein